MRARRFPEANKLLGPPEDMIEGCGTLSVYADGKKMISQWIPDEEDLKRLNAGEPLWLYVAGSLHPPVLMRTENPFES